VQARPLPRPLSQRPRQPQEAAEPEAEQPQAAEQADPGGSRAGRARGDPAAQGAVAAPSARNTPVTRAQRAVPEERHADRITERRDKPCAGAPGALAERAKAAERRAAAPAAEPLPPVHAIVEGARRVRQGIAVSDKAQKTITVRIDVARRHRRYEKIVRSSRNRARSR